MNKQSFTCVLVSDFNMQNFSGYIANDPAFPKIETIATPLGQVIPTLADKENPCWQDNPDAAVIWTQPQAIVSAFNDLLNYKQVPLQKVLAEVDQFASLLKEMSPLAKHVFVPAWVLPTYRRVFGLLDMRTGFGLTNTLMRMNLRLIENLEQIPNVHILNTHKWIEQAGPQSFSLKLWYLGKILFSNDLFKLAAGDLKAALSGILGYARKLIILDLDDTLWGGVVGDIGWEKLVLGGHHHLGEAFVDFQKALQALKNRGIILAIVSKNEEPVALEAIGQHPEMVLALEDFCAWRINWQDKAQNIVDLLAELNLGPQSAVFIDDNPAERARVRESLPEVLVPDWPDNPMLYPSALLGLSCFEIPSLSQEDFDRTTMYLSENKRQDLKKSVSSVSQWLSQLSIRVRIDGLKQDNLQRTAQLLNKTNQMNLSTRRLSEKELMAWAEHDGHKLWTLRVSDKFGDSGLTGIVSVTTRESSVQILDFVLSCRVMGREIEQVMLATAVDYARGLGIEEVFVQYLATPKNKPCLDLFRALTPPFERSGEKFCLKKEKQIAYPAHIEIVNQGR